MDFLYLILHSTKSCEIMGSKFAFFLVAWLVGGGGGININI